MDRAALILKGQTAFAENTAQKVRPLFKIVQVAPGSPYNRVYIEFKDGSTHLVDLGDLALQKLRNWESSVAQFSDSNPDLAHAYLQKAWQMVLGNPPLVEVIQKRGEEWCVIGHKKTKDGKRRSFGCYPTKAGAEKRLGQVQMFKHMKGAAEASEAKGRSRTGQDDTFEEPIKVGDKVQCVHTGNTGTVIRVTPDSGDSGMDVDYAVEWDRPMRGFKVTELHPGEFEIIQKVESIDFVGSGGSSGSRWKTFASKAPNEYDIVVDGESKGRIWSFRDPKYPKANVVAWGVSIDAVDGSKKFQYLRDAKAYAKEYFTSKAEAIQEDLSGSEAVYGFAAWLTGRKESVTMSATHNAGSVAELVAKFCKTNKLSEPRENWTDDLTHPTEEGKKAPKVEPISIKDGEATVYVGDKKYVGYISPEGWRELNYLADKGMNQKALRQMRVAGLELATS